MSKENELFYGRYRLLRSIGRGGFSVVWKALDEKTGTVVALKIFIRQDREGVELCRLEYAKAHNLIHQHILRPVFFDDHDDIPFLVMPFYERGTALALAGQAGEAELAKIMAQVGSALEYLHTRAAAVLHNDIKPDNLLVSDEGDYLLGDFGISGLLQQKLTQTIGASASAAQDGALLSGITPVAYRAPELFPMRNKPKEEPSTASDIWAFGACLYHLACGEPPFGGQGGLSQRISMAAGNLALPELLEDLPGRFSGPVNAWVSACLSPHPSERPSAGQIAAAARDFRQSGSWPPPPRLAAPPSPAPSPPAPSPEQKQSLPPRRQGLPAWVWLLAVVLLYAGAFGVYKTRQADSCKHLLAEAEGRFQAGEYQAALDKFRDSRHCHKDKKSLDERIKRCIVLAKLKSYPFSFPGGEGLAAVSDTVAGRLRWGFLDTLTGRLAIDIRYDSVTPFSEGKASAWRINRRFEIGRDGKERPAGDPVPAGD